MADKKYKKICAVRNATNSVKVWSDEDHFLFAIGNGYSEEYFRFFYSDINFLKINLLRFFMLWIVLSSILFVILLASALLVNNDVISVFLWIAAGADFVLVPAFLWMGPRARLTIATPTTNKTIYFGRKRKALKTLRKLCSHIYAAEGMADREELFNRLTEAEKEFKV